MHDVASQAQGLERSLGSIRGVCQTGETATNSVRNLCESFLGEEQRGLRESVDSYARGAQRIAGSISPAEGGDQVA